MFASSALLTSQYSFACEIWKMYEAVKPQPLVNT